PRVLQWLSAGHWFWIHTPDARMNDRACGMEWMSAPLLLFTRTDRLLFVLNFVPYVLLPGLFFTVWRQFGVSGRVSWWWMWLAPTMYGFLLQAGSTGNDIFPVIYLLAAMAFAFRLGETRNFSDLAYSTVSMALAIGAKPTALPLCLPWALILARAAGIGDKGASAGALLEGIARGWKRNFWKALAVAAVALLISFLPTALLNIHYCGDWSGAKIENKGLAVGNPIVGIWGNGMLLLFKNFFPPLFPWAGWWNEAGPRLLPGFIYRPMAANFEPGFHVIGEVPTEEWAGAGFGISVLVLVSLIAGWFLRRRASAGKTWDKFGFLLRGSCWVALLAFCAKSGMVDAARLAAPYYPFLLPALLTGRGQSRVTRQRWWRLLAAVVFLLALMVLVIAPARPLFPARTLLAKLEASHPQSHSLQRAENVYTVFGERSDPLAAVRNLLPAGLRVVGFMGTQDDIDVSLWRPFFSRRVEYVMLGDSGKSLRERNLRYIVVGDYHLKQQGVALDSWLKKVNAELVAQTTAIQKLSEGPQIWYVVRLRGAEPK
ncbi:MAG TPA: hypothetical protein VHH88_01650, partial [Verrucomicrobiae bacterium]|nr:hypothetical protein [Verrucomicrobiae bacterium]